MKMHTRLQMEGGRLGFPAVSTILNVLLIEDDAIDAEMVARLLSHSRSKAGKANIIHVDYFSKGLDVLAQNKNVDVVILDLHLPDGEGLELIRQLNDQYSELPVIVLTGQDAGDTLGVELVREGAEDYVDKNSVSEHSLKRSLRYAIERRSLMNKIKRQSQKLEEYNKELESFTYIASHDLRAPLINIKGFSAELKYSIETLRPLLDKASHALTEQERSVAREAMEENMPAALDFVQASAEKMNRLIEALLQYSRLGRRKLSYKKIDMNDLVRQTVNSMSHQIKTVRAQISIGELPAIIADRVSIEQVLGNLLDNAVKYLDPERPGEISITGYEAGSGFTFCIMDNGVGIKDDDKCKVFQIFRRAGSVGKIPGEGIGMPNARAIIRRHGGDIWFTSTPGKGSGFYFTVPHNLLENKDVNNDE